MGMILFQFLLRARNVRQSSISISSLIYILFQIGFPEGEDIVDIQEVKNLEEVKSITPIKSIQEVVGIYPLTEELAQKLREINAGRRRHRHRH